MLYDSFLSPIISVLTWKAFILVRCSCKCWEYLVTTSNEYTKALLYNSFTLKILFQLFIEYKIYSLLWIFVTPYWKWIEDNAVKKKYRRDSFVLQLNVLETSLNHPIVYFLAACLKWILITNLSFQKLLKPDKTS